MRSINSIGTFWYIMIDIFKYKIDIFFVTADIPYLPLMNIKVCDLLKEGL